MQRTIVNGYPRHMPIKKLIAQPIDTNEDIPSILDFNITLQEAQFISEYFRCNGDEHEAAINCGLVTKDTDDEEVDKIVNNLIANPCVQNAIKAAMSDGMKKSLLTYNMAMSQIANIVCADPIDMFDKDCNLLPLPKMPRRIRYAISEFEVKSIFGKGNKGGGIIGTVTKVKLHDKKAMLQTLLSELNGKTSVNGVQINQYNNTNITNNTQNNIDPSKLSDQELDSFENLLVKMGVIEDNGKEKEIKQLQEIEQCGMQA